MTITKEGSLASFYTVNKASIKHLRVYFSPKLAGEGDPSLENIRPIEGWDNIQFAHSGKSLFPFKKTLIGPLSSWLNGTNMWWVKNELVDVFLKGRTVTFSAEFDTTGVTDDNNRCGVKLWSRNLDGTWGILGREGTYISKGNIGRSKITLTYTNYKENEFGATLPAGAITSKPMVELGSIMTEYEPYQGSMQTIDWSNDIGTIYGGYLDLITGELVLQYDMYSASWKDWSSSTDLGNNTRKAKTIPYIPVGGNASTTSLCNLTNNYLWSNSDDSIHFYIANSSNTVYAILPNSLDENLEVLISYKLKNPITYLLTPTQLQTFVGQNNIWSNADRVEVEYDLAESNDELYRRRNIILQSAPHLETATGDIANFNTDLVAPIKDAKIYFNPVLKGEGDPSPENVREISGWTGCSIYLHGRNLIDKNSLIVGLWWKEIIYGSTYYPNHYRTPLIPVKPGASYYLSRISGNQDYLSYFDKNQTYVQQVIWSSNAPVTKLIPDDIYYVGINIKISEVDSAIFLLAEQDISYTTFISNITVPIDWTSNGTIYGGYIDLVKGELILEWRKVFLKDLSWANYSSKIHYYTNLRLNNTTYAREYNSFIYSDTLTSHNLGFASEEVGEFTYYTLVNSSATLAQNYKNNIWTKLPEAMEREEANNWIKTTYPNASIVYKLENPIHYQLTPQQLTALKGVNNIWSDANGPISIQYWTH